MELGVAKVNIMRSIKGYFSGYTIFLLLLSAYVLIVMDWRQLKSQELKKEARFSMAAGIVYAIIALAAVVISFLSPL